MVALSVSISAISSPDFTVSPTFLCHLAITPSVIVSLIFGIRTISAILSQLKFDMNSKIDVLSRFSSATPNQKSKN